MISNLKLNVTYRIKYVSSNQIILLIRFIQQIQRKKTTHESIRTFKKSYYAEASVVKTCCESTWRKQQLQSNQMQNVDNLSVMQISSKKPLLSQSYS